MDFSFRLSCRVGREENRKRAAPVHSNRASKSYEDENRSDFLEPAENDAWRLYARLYAPMVYDRLDFMDAVGCIFFSHLFFSKALTEFLFKNFSISKKKKENSLAEHFSSF